MSPSSILSSFSSHIAEADSLERQLFILAGLIVYIVSYLLQSTPWHHSSTISSVEGLIDTYSPATETYPLECLGDVRQNSKLSFLSSLMNYVFRSISRSKGYFR